MIFDFLFGLIIGILIGVVFSYPTRNRHIRKYFSYYETEIIKKLNEILLKLK